MKPETVDALSKPFPPDRIKQRKGSHGKMLAYVAGADVIGRLNAIWPSWDFEVISEEVKQYGDKPEIIMLGKLTIDGVTHKQYGSHVHNGEWGDTYKAAMTDCLKKCASLFGVALQLYDEPTGDDKATETRKDTTKPETASSEQGTMGEPAMATEGQKKMLFARHKETADQYPLLSAALLFYAGNDTPTTMDEVQAMVKTYDRVKQNQKDITRAPKGVPMPDDKPAESASAEPGSINDVGEEPPPIGDDDLPF